MVKKLLLFLFLSILLVNTAYALDVDTYGVNFNLVSNKAVVEVNIILKEPTIELFEFQLPEDYSALSVYVDDTLISSEVEDNVLKIDLNSNSKIEFNYITTEFLDRTNFLMNMNLDFAVDNLMIKLVLPEGASLKKPISNNDLSSGSIFPKPTQATTDGKNLIFYWLEKDLQENEEISIFAQIEPKENYSWLFVTFIVVLITVIALLAYFLQKKPKTKVVVRKEDKFEHHLKEDEEQIVNVLKQRKGSCEQATLRVITGHSKAQLSRILAELEHRKFITKERKGRKNIIHLKKR